MNAIKNSSYGCESRGREEAGKEAEEEAGKEAVEEEGKKGRKQRRKKGRRKRRPGQFIFSGTFAWLFIFV